MTKVVLALQRLTGEHTISSSGAGEKKQSPQKLFPLEKTGLKLNRKVIRDGHRMQRDKGWARRCVGSSSLTSGRNRKREKARTPEVMPSQGKFLEVSLPEAAQPDTLKNVNGEKWGDRVAHRPHNQEENWAARGWRTLGAVPARKSFLGPLME